SAAPGTDGGSAADGNGSAPGVDAALEAGETGRWFRPAKKKKYVTIPPEEQSDGARLPGVATDAEPSGTAAMEDPAEPAADPAAPDPGLAPRPRGTDTQERRAEVWSPPYRAADWAM